MGAGGPPASDEVALAGADGAKAAALLRNAKNHGVVAFGVAVAAALDRLLTRGPHAVLSATKLLDDRGLAEVADALAATTGTAELLGRLRIRKRQRAVEGGRRVFAAQATDYGATFATTDHGPPLLPPRDALEYFLGLEPRLAVSPGSWAVLVERRAFMLAAATDEVMLGLAKSAIQAGLEGGGLLTATDAVRRLLDPKGTSSPILRYAEMAVRTNMMASYNAGSTREIQYPDVADTFPVWRYVGIRDGRQGADHEPKFDRYYPNEASFEEVRGDRPWNCRCTMIPVDYLEWADLRSAGDRVEVSW